MDKSAPERLPWFDPAIRQALLNLRKAQVNLAFAIQVQQACRWRWLHHPDPFAAPAPRDDGPGGEGEES
jgi:hypothetical protein